MRRIIVIASSLALAFGLLSAPALAQPSTPLDLSNYTGSIQYDAGIEKQTWTDSSGVKYHIVSNPTNCSWDVNDHSQFIARGDVAPGSVTSTTFCNIFVPEPLYACYSGFCAWWNGHDNWVGVKVTAKTADVRTSLCFAQQTRCFNLTPAYSKSARLWVSSICAIATYAGDPYDPAVVEIPNSNGGIGVPTDITVSIRGTQTKSSIRDVWAQWGVSSDQFFPYGCGSDPNYVTTSKSYPFRWVEGLN